MWFNFTELWKNGLTCTVQADAFQLWVDSVDTVDKHLLLALAHEDSTRQLNVKCSMLAGAQLYTEFSFYHVFTDTWHERRAIAANDTESPLSAIPQTCAHADNAPDNVFDVETWTQQCINGFYVQQWINGFFFGISRGSTRRQILRNHKKLLHLKRYRAFRRFIEVPWTNI